MKNLDSLTLKFFLEENKSFLKNAKIQKIQMPSRFEIFLHLRNNQETKKFYVNINPKYPHICFLKEKNDFFKIPKEPPMFCMQLRKYLDGAKIEDAILIQYDRILEFHFSIFNEFGINTPLVLAIELMGKYSNVILYNKKTSIITGCAHNVSFEKSSVREVFGGIKYIYPKVLNKKDILKTSFDDFKRLYYSMQDDVYSSFFYFTKQFFQFLKNKAKNEEELYKLMQQASIESSLIKEFWQNFEDFNSIIEKYFSITVKNDCIEHKKNKLSKIINGKIKGEDKIINEKINFEKYEEYKKMGDLIFQYIYLIKDGCKFFEVEGVKIKLDENKSPAYCAQKYYKLYSKAKKAKEIFEKRIQEAKEKKKYLEEILFSIETAKTLYELDEIEDEIDETILLKPKQTTQKPKIKTETFMGYEILIGKNNKQNDYIIKKLSSKEDIWLHAQNCPSCHVVIKIKDKNEIPNDVLLYAANIVKAHSPLKESKKAGIIYTKKKYIKRPNNTPSGYVTYKNEKEIII